MNILITGGTGFIGNALTQRLAAQGHTLTVLSRHADSVALKCGADIQVLTDLNTIKPQDSYHVVINLAGAPIFDQLWTAKRKNTIRNSRIALTQQLIDVLAKLEQKPDLLISGSAIGYYGSQGDSVLTENSANGNDFSAQLCIDWERTALQAEQLGVRVCLIRTGLVIASSGGLLQRLLPLFRLGLGGRLGDGQQWMSWIHREDWLAIAETMIANPAMRGAYNATAPNPVNNLEFTKTLAQTLNRPALLPTPAIILKTLLGEMSELVLGSQRVIPDRLLQQGFSFNYQNLSAALSAELNPTIQTKAN